MAQILLNNELREGLFHLDQKLNSINYTVKMIFAHKYREREYDEQWGT